METRTQDGNVMVQWTRHLVEGTLEPIVRKHLIHLLTAAQTSLSLQNALKPSLVQTGIATDRDPELNG